LESLNRSHLVSAGGQLIDETADFVQFFQRCAKGLKPGGLIFVKENICQHGTDGTLPAKLMDFLA